MGKRIMTDHTMDKFKPNISQRRKKNVDLQVDLPLLIFIIILISLGMIIMFSASADVSSNRLEKDITYLFVKQSGFLLLGIVAAGLFYFWDYRIWKQYVPKGFLAINLILLAVLLFGAWVLGSRRSFSGGSYMPGEPAKLITIAYLALWLTNNRKNITKFWDGVLPYTLLMSVVGGLIIFQPDISAAFTIFLMGMLLYFLAGGKFQYILAFAGLGGILIWVVSLISSRTALLLSTYFQGFIDPNKTLDHVRIAETGIIQAGLWGSGLGNGSIKYTIPLPHNDSIFAVAAQELGLIGASIIILLFMLVVWRGMVIAFRAPDAYGSLLAAGISFWIGIEAFMNIAVMLGLMPFAGNALPFFSTGGSNLVVMVTAIGILLGISRVEKQKDERTEHAVIGMRRRNRGGRVSRSRRVADVEQSND